MYLGIDPGSKGGVSIINDSGEIASFCPMMPIHDFLELDLSGVKKCFIEKSQSRPGQGAQGTFNYGVHQGELLGFLAAHRIPYELVPPQRWQKRILGKFSKGCSKKAAYAKAKQLWPNANFVMKGCRVPHDGVIDSCLIAEWGRLYG